MSKRDDAVFLYHIFEACQNIITMLKGDYSCGFS